MKFVGVRDAQQKLSGLVAEAQKDRIVLTRHGKPVAMLMGIQGKDFEEVLLEQDPAFWRLIEKRRQSNRPGIPLEEALVQAREEQAKDGGVRAGRRRRAQSPPKRRIVPKAHA